MAGLLALIAVSGLAWLLLHRATPPTPSAELTQKRLTFNSSENPVQSSAISADGKYLAYSDRAAIHVKLLSTGEERLSPRPARVPAGASWDVASWFPDGTQLLAVAYQVDSYVSTWTVSVLGQSPRQLQEGAGAFPQAVSPDGTHIIFTPELQNLNHEVWMMGSQGDNQQKVLTLGENEWVVNVRWSPDGQRLVYIKGQHTEAYRSSIETCDLKGTSRTVVVPDSDLWVSDFLWLPDLRIIYSRQESLGSDDANLWQIDINGQAGTPAGKPKRITQWPGSFFPGLSASADGRRLALQKTTYHQQVYLGELAAGGTRMSPPPRRLNDDEASEFASAWTADSKAVLFHSDRNGPWGIFKQAISQDTAEVLVAGPQSLTLPRLSADGKWILYHERPKTPGPSTPVRLMRIPVGGGAPQLVLETRGEPDYRCARAPASLCVISEPSADGKEVTYAAFDPLKGRGNALRTIQNPTAEFLGTALSPDGTTLALSRTGEAEIHIRLLSLAGKPDQEFTVKGWPNLTGLDWSADGKGLYCGSVSPQSRTLLYVDLKGDARVLWQYKGTGGGIWGVPSPDGRYVAIGALVTNSNVWMLEGF